MTFRRFGYLIACLCFAQTLAFGQLLNDTLDDDPRDAGWIFSDVSFWVAPDSPECFDQIEADTGIGIDGQPCNFYPEDDEEGYIIVAPVGTTGSVFNDTVVTFDNFTMQAVVELREGSATRADGMAIVLIGSDEAPFAPGGGGGNLGATGLAGGTFPTLLFEFDNWNNGAIDANNNNHVAVHYSATGINDVNSPLGQFDIPAETPLNNRLVWDERLPNRWKFTAVLQENPAGGATAGIFLEAIDAGVNYGLVLTVDIPDYVPFDGFFGVTGASGGETQHHILHEVFVTEEALCLLPPATVTRSAAFTQVPDEFCGGNFADGDSVLVTLTVESVRADDDDCDAPANLSIVEQLPEGWSARGVSNGGDYDDADNTITWEGVAAAAGTELTYTVTPEVVGRFGSGQIRGAVSDGGNSDDAAGIAATNFRQGDDPDTCVAEEFDDVFLDDPFDTGWVLQGASTWVEPGSPYCEDVDGNPTPNSFDPFLPCLLYTEDEIEGLAEVPVAHQDDPNDLDNFGYLIVVPSDTSAGQAGNAFRDEQAVYSNFQLDVVLEIRDGTIGRPADGMCVVVIGTQDPPGIGAGGGAMGATGLGDAPTMIFEFDNWSCNGGDNNNENHVGFGWEANGFPGVDAIANDVFFPIDGPQLHPREAPPASPNRILMSVRVQGGTVACNLNFIDQGIDLGTVYTYRIPDFQPFNGFLGVTAATGGANQNHIMHSAKLTPLEGVCIQPAGDMVRSFEGIAPPDFENTNGGQFVEGDVIDVSIEVTRVREGDGDSCEAPDRVLVTDSVPDGWEVSNISAGGTETDGTVSWALDDFSVGDRVSYSVTAGPADRKSFAFNGSNVDIDDAGNPVVGASASQHGGDTALQSDSGFNDCGAIISWNILGPYAQPAGQDGAGPGDDNIRQDYLTDGDVTEFDDSFWIPGTEVETDYGAAAGLGEAWSDGLRVGPDGLDVDTVPAVLGIVDDGDGWINLNDDVFGGDPNNCMAYMQCWVMNETEDDMELGWGASSDDSIQILLNGEEIWINSIPRGAGSVCAGPQDRSLNGNGIPMILEPGPNSLVLKVFEGGGGFNGSFRFESVFGQPITDGLSISKTAGPVDPPGGGFIRGDADASGSINITDGIYLLNFLFLGGPAPTCEGAGNADGAGGINITDGIYLLNFLFLGGGPPPAPYPDCGEAADDCASFPPCEA